MPTYRVTDSSTGVVLKLTGDSPPTEQELADIFAVNSGKTSPDQQTSSVGRIAADIGIEAGGSMAGTILGTALAPFTAGASIPIGAVVGGAIGGGLGNIAVQRGQISRGERPEFSYGELLATVGLSAVPAGALGSIAIKSAAAKAAAAKLAGNVTPALAESFGRKIGTTAAQGALLAGGGEVIKNAIDQQRLPTANEFLTATVFGGGLGAGIGGIERGVSKALSYTPEVILGNLVPIIKRVQGESAELATEGQFALQNLVSAFDSIKDRGARELAKSKSMLYLKGESNNIANVPIEVENEVKAVRDIIDTLKDSILSRGLVQKDDELWGNGLYNKIVQNDGAYIRRAFRIFDGKWKPSTELFQKFVNSEVDAEIEKKINRTRIRREGRENLRVNTGAALEAALTKQRAGIPLSEIESKILNSENKFGFNTNDLDALRLQLMGPLKRGVVLPFGKDEIKDEIETKYRKQLTQEYTNYANQLLDKKNAFSALAGDPTTFSSALFIPRKNLSPLGREFLGEINDPVYAASETISLISKTLATHSVLKQVRKAGVDSGLFRTASIEGDVLLHKGSSGIEDLNPSPLAGIYTTPLIKEAFEDISTNQVGALAKKFGAIASISSALKIPKTLLSVKGYASNLWGGMLDTVAQGHGLEFFETGNWKQGAKIAGYNLGVIRPDGSVDGKAMQKLYADMRREGISTANVPFSDLMRGFQMNERPLVDAFPELAGSKTRKAIENLGKLYSTPELMSKVFNLSGELKSLSKAFPDQTRDQLFKEAARRVRLTTQDYDSLPRFLKDFSSIGALDPFVAYSADRFRVVYNTFKLGIEDMASGNTALMKSGAKRVATMTSVLGAAGYLAANPHLSPEEEKALRNRMPEWDREGMVHIKEPDADGNFKYTNLNYNLPHSAAIEAMQAATRGKDPEEAFSNFMSSISKQAFGTNLLIAPVAEISAGKNRYGLPITSEGEPLYRQVFDKSKYFLDQTVMPLALSEINKFVRVLNNKGEKVTTSSGETYGIGELVAENFGGVRYKTINLAQRLKVGVSSISRNLSEDNISFSSQKKRSLSPEETTEAYNQYEKRYGNTYSKALEFVNDSKVLGIEENDIVGIMKAGNLPSSLILGAVSGIYTPPALDNVNPATALYEEVEKMPENQRLGKIEQLARDNPTYARSLVNRYRQDVRNETLGIDAVDKLILAQSELDGDRASFIFRKMKSLPDDTMRTLYLENLKKKGIVTIAVNSQLNQMFKAGGRTPETVKFPVSQ